MHWLYYFVLGFLAFPICGLAVLLIVHLRSQARPTEVSSAQDLQSQLRALLETGKHGDTLFILWLPLRFELRVHKRVRKSESDTIWLELRNSDANRAHYEAARKALHTGSVEFVEAVTHARRRPRRLPSVDTQKRP
jgi:hypothetical protein